MHRFRIHFIILLVIMGFYVLYFAGLGANPLLDPDEPIYGQFVKEMVRSGDWLTPHYAGKLWFDKPPMYYWLASVSVKTFGLSEFALRLPSALCAVGIVLIVFLLASYDFGRRTGVFASLVIATTMMQIIMSHAAATDAIMVFFLVIALYAYRLWLDTTGRKRFVWIAICGCATGFGMLTKGPVVPLLLTVTFFIHLWWTKSLRKLRMADAAIGTITALVMGLPWYIAMCMMHGRAFVDGFIITNNLARFAAPLHKSQTGYWYSYLRNVPIMLAFFLPWSVFLPQAVKKYWRANNGAKLLVTWFAVVMVFFSASKTQNFTYTYPAFPAAAILVGILFAKATKGEKSSAKSISIGIRTGLAISLLLAAALVIFAVKRFPAAIMPASVIGISLVGAFAISLIGSMTRRIKVANTVWITTGGMLVFTLVLIYCAMPIVSRQKSTKLIAERIAALDGVKVAAFNLWRPGLFYYLDEKPIDISNKAQISELMSDCSPIVIICKENDEDYIEQEGSKELFGIGDLDVYQNHECMRRDRRLIVGQVAYNSFVCDLSNVRPKF
ncbi:glycosyltransferase family 39 protein [bacterium]|nr:glycosyltransferase family 39 protein [bacterium]